MAGMFYLPRIFVYHAERAINIRECQLIFDTMEFKLYKYIMTPAMIATWISGFYLGIVGGWLSALSPWLLLKLMLVVAMTVMHHMLGAWRSAFAQGRNRHSGRFFRFANEVPTILFVFIVILAVVQPF